MAIAYGRPLGYRHWPFGFGLANRGKVADDVVLALLGVGEGEAGVVGSAPSGAWFPDRALRQRRRQLRSRATCDIRLVGAAASVNMVLPLSRPDRSLGRSRQKAGAGLTHPLPAVWGTLSARRLPCSGVPATACYLLRGRVDGLLAVATR